MTQELTDRNKLQDNMADYLANRGSLLLLWGTSVGKSFVAIKAFFRYLETNPTAQFLLVVAETAHKENWRKEFIKCLGEKKAEVVLEHTTIECYASLKNYTDTVWDIVCCDEVHHIFSDTRITVLETIITNRFLGLSATVKKDNIVTLQNIFPGIKIHRVTTQQAIDNDFIPEPNIVCIPLELNRFERTESVILDYTSLKIKDKGVIDDIWSNRWKYMKDRKAYTGYRIQLACTQKEKYEYFNEQFEYWKKQYFKNPGNVRMKNMWLQWGTKRKRLLGELKTEEVKNLCLKLSRAGKRFICFCSSIEQAESLGGKNCIHSRKRDTKEVIKEFNSKKIYSIYAVGMLVEGVSLTDIEVEVIVQLDGEERQFIQKLGRVLRADFPVQYILYYRDTRDEEYLQKALEGIDKNYIQEI